MTPSLALSFCLLFIVSCIVIDEKYHNDFSKALIIPLIWAFILSSRFVSRWFFFIGWYNFDPGDIIEGSPVDRVVFLVLESVAFLIVVHNRKKLSINDSSQLCAYAFLGFCGISILWSDYTYISFKRFIKEIGTVLCVLVITTREKPLESVNSILRKVGYIVIPLSVVLIKYFPELGREYHRQTGEMMALGVTTHKNSLGAISMIYGLIFLWNLFFKGKQINQKYFKINMILQIIMVILAIWMLDIAKSMTSTVLAGIGVCLLISLRKEKHTENFRKIMSATLILTGIVVLFESLFNISEYFFSLLGKSSTLTDRTMLWDDVFQLSGNFFFGVGYDSFWLGPRLEELWMKWWWQPNQAHNGFIEVFLNIGMVGLTILLIWIFFNFKNLYYSESKQYEFKSLKLIMLTILLIYNITEAAIARLHIGWFLFLTFSFMSLPPGDDKAEDVGLEQRIEEKIPQYW